MPDGLQSYFRFRLAAALAAPDPTPTRSAACWARVAEVEVATGRRFGDVVHELRLAHPPPAVPGLLGVTRHFLYEHFGWAMDKAAWVERTYGASLAEIVAHRRAEEASVASLDREWGLSPSTLYGALQRAPGAAKLGPAKHFAGR